MGMQAQGEHQGQALGVAAAPLGWAPAGAGQQGDMGITAAAHHWAHHPGWMQPSFSLLWCWWCDWSSEASCGEQVTLYLVSAQGTNSAAVGRPPTSVLENSAGSQELLTAALLMTSVVVLGNSLSCLWVSSPVSKKGMILLCNLQLKWLIIVLQMSRSCHVLLPLAWRGLSAFVKKPWLQEHNRLWGLFCFGFFSLLTYETDQTDSWYQSANHHYRPFESWPPLLPFSFLSATPFLTVHSSYQTFPKRIKDRVPNRVKMEILVQAEGEILAVKLRVCCWCSEIEKCSAFFFETHSAWRLCSFQTLAWLPTWDVLFLKKKTN